ncbi:hypothetical protein C8R45DRAFT_1192814 [Mycena sanguinolenta]|nr:hypothetical protein C8R45DRAFT_1192814 [Mycena sanguinolenta]
MRAAEERLHIAFPDLPQKLVDNIIDHLHDDICSLKFCSLAGRMFLASARTHRFGKMTISDHISSGKLLAFLASSPHIAPFVNGLRIVFTRIFLPVYNGYFGHAEARYIPWLQDHPPQYMVETTLSRILSLLLQLKRISAVENDRPRCTMDWTILQPELKLAMKGVFSAPLQSVQLRGITVESPQQLLSFFSEIETLDELSLSRVYFTAESLTNSVAISAPEPRLTYLFISTPLRTVDFFVKSMLRFMASFFNACVDSSAANLEFITFQEQDCGESVILDAAQVDSTIEAALLNLPSLKMVKVRRVWDRGEYRRLPRNTGFNTWAVAVRTGLPSLEKRGFLRVGDAHHDGLLRDFE